ncbi:hypothetical protein FSP39_012893 [Pinctada imbricata]|uniref:SWIM-type domain-containing protein n=1 Tax=Pinctada imbricata TaxID=66713 RepID=A0AA88YHC3_PINIB|nr:hypothetical protein FSP39_012893 [Pinctada imbricata]
MGQLKTTSSFVPAVLHNTPKPFLNHCLSRLNNTDDLIIHEVDEQKFEVHNKDSGGTCTVNLGNRALHCTCPDWKRHCMPCKHFLKVVIQKRLQWNDLPSDIKCNPLFNIDKAVTSLSNQTTQSTQSSEHQSQEDGTQNNEQESDIDHKVLSPVSIRVRKMELKIMSRKVILILQLLQGKCQQGCNLPFLIRATAIFKA